MDTVSGLRNYVWVGLLTPVLPPGPIFLQCVYSERFFCVFKNIAPFWYKYPVNNDVNRKKLRKKFKEMKPKTTPHHHSNYVNILFLFFFRFQYNKNCNIFDWISRFAIAHSHLSTPYIRSCAHTFLLKEKHFFSGWHVWTTWTCYFSTWSTFIPTQIVHHYRHHRLLCVSMCACVLRYVLDLQFSIFFSLTFCIWTDRLNEKKSQTN